MGDRRTTAAEKEANPTLQVVKATNISGVFYQLKNGCNWGDLPKDLPPYSTVFWHYKQWRSEGVLEEILSRLHSQVREPAQKNRIGRDY